uniref:Gag-pol polyprotein n=1 Tax=Solanum tuberosum TaxID=4113 RepID=M1DZZ4_SOLTU
MVPDMNSRMSLFVSWLSRLSSKEGKTTMLIGDMDITRLMIHVQQVEEDKTFSVSTLVGEFILVERVYRDCIIYVNHKDTMADLVELEMVDFDIILGASLSFVTPYIAMNFDILPEQLLKPFSVSTPVGESMLVERVYHDCTISVNHKDNMANLVELDMVDFDVILG